MANKLGRAKFHGNWEHGENDTFVVTLQITNLPTKEDRDLILHKVGSMMHRLLIEAQECTGSGGVLSRANSIGVS